MMAKRLTAVLLTTAMMLGIFACKPTENESLALGETEVQAEIIKLDNAYIETKLDIDFGEYNYFEYTCANGRVYYTKNENVIDEETGNLIGQSQKIISCDENGGDAQVIWENAASYPDEDTDIQSYVNLRSFGIDSSGNLWIVIQNSTYDNTNVNNPVYTSTNELRKLGPDGTELAVSDLSEAQSDGNYFYIQSLCFDKDDNVYLQANEQVVVIDGETAEVAFVVEAPNYIYGIAATNTGEVIYATYAGEGYTIIPIDYAAKTAKPPLNYNGAHYFNYLFNGSGEYGFYYTYNDYIYGMNLETMTSEVVINFLNSDIDSTYIEKLYPLSDGKYIINKRPWDNNGESGIFMLTANPNASVEGKALLTLGAVYLDSYTRSAVQKFNKASDTARIQVVDYSQYNTRDEYSAGITQLDMDILGGKAPDIISMSGLNPTKYISKGVLADLTELLENDSSINRADLFENILEAGSQNGNLYHIIAYFSVMSLVGKTSLFGNASEISMAKINGVADQFPEAELIPDFNATQWLNYCILFGLDGFIDWANGTCNFNSEEFIALLKSAKHFPAELDTSYYMDMDSYQEYVNDYKVKFIEDRALLQFSQLSNVRAARDTEVLFGEDVSYLGFPSSDSGGAVIGPQSDFAISGSSKNKEQAWNFIRMFLSGEVEFDDNWGTSILRSVFEEKAAVELIPMAERDYSKGVQITESFGNGISMWTVNSFEELGDEYENYHLTEAEVAKVRGVIEGATRVYSGNEKIMEIITEEAEAFIAGSKTAEDIALIIQSRISIYVSENT